MLSTAFFAMLLSAAPPEMMIPEGTVLPIVLNETISTAKLQDNEPILFRLAEDVRAGGSRGPVLIPRGSSVVGRVVKSERAGHFIGRSEIDIRIQEIVTPSGVVYDGLTTKIVEVGKNKGEKGQVNPNGEILGPIHRERDTLLLLFPPTTLFQLLALPRRGPDVVLPVETRLYVKLMNPIYAESRVALNTAAPAQLPAQVSRVAPQPVPEPVPRALPRLSSNSLDLMVTPIALYPDTILRDVLLACTHPFQIVEANQSLQQRRGVDGNWDSSVQALAAYPDLLLRLSADVTWTTNLGLAFGAQPADVMNAVQRVRIQANSYRSSATVPVVAWRR